jgi:predicted esterase
MSVTRTLQIETPTHGRVLMAEAATIPARGVLIAFHGYAESADVMQRHLEGVGGIDAWTVVSVQGLHRFYTRDNKTVIASWMTREDRDLAIADNTAYVARVVSEAAPTGPLVFLGYSQGAAMAYRAAAAHRDRTLAVIAIGGDIPPDVDPARLPRTLIGVGEKDHWYTSDKVSADQSKLNAARIPHDLERFPTGHEWSEHVRRVVGAWLNAVVAM